MNHVKLNTAITKIYKDGDIFIVECLNDKFKSRNVVLATGSKSYPHTGSSGDGLKFAKDLGIDYTDFTPAETHIYSNQVVKELSVLQGYSLKNVVVRIKGRNKKAQGDVLITILTSGPAIMHLSEDYDCLQTKKLFFKYHLEHREEIDLFNISRTT